MISPQWLSKLRWLWLCVPWQVVCELISWKVPTLCLDSSIVSPLRLCLVKDVSVFRSNLPPALLAEWPGSFKSHCSDTGVEWTPNKSQHTNLTLEKKILLPLLPRFRLATFWSWVRHSTNKLFRIQPNITHAVKTTTTTTTKNCAFKHVKTTEILKSFCPLQHLNTDDQMSGMLHGWERNKSDMCWTIYRCEITTFFSDPRSTFIFSHWGSLCACLPKQLK